MCSSGNMYNQINPFLFCNFFLEQIFQKPLQKKLHMDYEPGIIDTFFIKKTKTRGAIISCSSLFSVLPTLPVTAFAINYKLDCIRLLQKIQVCFSNQTILLFKIFHTGFKDLQILLSVDIDCYRITAAFGMCHLSKYSSIRTCDTFDRTVGAIDIPLFVHTDIS